MNILEKNLSALLRQDLSLTLELTSYQQSDKFEIFFDQKEPLNINIIDTEDYTPLYKKTPLEENHKRLGELKSFQRIPYLYFYGLGNGVLFKMLLQNQQLKRVLVVEPEIDILYMILNVIDFSKEIQEGRVVFLLEKDISFGASSKYFTKKDVRIYSKLYELIVTSDYYEKYRKSILSTNKAFIELIHHSVVGAGNDSADALIGVEHHFMNLPSLIKTPKLTELLKKIKIKPTAILVATGPSLTKQLELLKQVQDYAVIVAVDASFPILYKNNIKPDIVVSMERIPLTGEFFKKTPKEAHEGVIFALSSLQHPNVINNIKAGTKQISMRPFGYTRALKLDEWGYLGIGMSAANMAYELIYHGGFQNCILIGQDLAYSEDGKSHAKSHILGENEVKNTQGDFLVTKYGGQGKIRTNAVWNMFKNYFETDIEITKEKMNTINSTEGGAQILGTKELSFQQAIDSFIDLDSEKKQKITLNYPSKKELIQLEKQLNEKTNEIKVYSQEKIFEIKELFLEFAKECKFLEELDIENDLEKVNFERLNVLNEKLEEVKKYFTDIEFLKIFLDATQAFIVHQEIEIAKIVVREIKDEKDKKIKMIDWIKAHRFWLFSLAGCMEAVLIAINRKGEHYNAIEGQPYDWDYKDIKDSIKKQIDSLNDHI